MATAYIGLGANLGDPVQNIIDARRQLYQLPGVGNWRCSSLYLSTPVGYAEQPDFINCVVELCGELQPQSLFADMQDIEHRLGRERDPDNQNAPRLIDLDLLLCDQTNLDTPHLVLPHPRMHLRKFVLQPLFELAPDLVIGDMGSVRELLHADSLSDQHVFKLS